MKRDLTELKRLARETLTGHYANGRHCHHRRDIKSAASAV